MKIKSKTRFWKNPIKWNRDRKIVKILNSYINQEEVQQELYVGLKEITLKGQVMMKDGKVIRTTK